MTGGDSSTSALVVFDSWDGQTKKIAAAIAESIAGRGGSARVSLAESNPDPDPYDLVIVGGPVHRGRHSAEIRRWLSTHHGPLRRLPVAVFQVSLSSAHHDATHEAMAHAALQGLLDETRVEPALTGLFAGALRYTRYGWLKRRLMRLAAAGVGESTDMSRDHEYTDWDAVDDFAAAALDLPATR